MSERKPFTIAGLPVEDADEPLSLIITKKDVMYGNTKDPTGCAAARCLMRQPYVEEARVHITRTYVKIKGKWYRYRTPQALKQEIVSFDRGGTFQPGEFELGPCPTPDWERRGKAHSPNDKSGSSTKGPRNKPHRMSGIRHDALRK